MPGTCQAEGGLPLPCLSHYVPCCGHAQTHRQAEGTGPWVSCGWEAWHARLEVGDRDLGGWTFFCSPAQPVPSSPYPEPPTSLGHDMSRRHSCLPGRIACLPPSLGRHTPYISIAWAGKAFPKRKNSGRAMQGMGRHGDWRLDRQAERPPAQAAAAARPCPKRGLLCHACLPAHAGRRQTERRLPGQAGLHAACLWNDSGGMCHLGIMPSTCHEVGLQDWNRLCLHCHACLPMLGGGKTAAPACLLCPLTWACLTCLSHLGRHWREKEEEGCFSALLLPNKFYTAGLIKLEENLPGMAASTPSLPQTGARQAAGRRQRHLCPNTLLPAPNYP